MSHEVILAKVKKFIKGVRYKPGSFFAAGEIAKSDPELQGVLLITGLKVQSINKPEETTVIEQKMVIPWPVLERVRNLRKFLSRQIRKVIHSGELHEADEWLIIDGERVFDPHKTKE